MTADKLSRGAMLGWIFEPWDVLSLDRSCGATAKNSNSFTRRRWEARDRRAPKRILFAVLSLCPRLWVRTPFLGQACSQRNRENDRSDA